MSVVKKATGNARDLEAEAKGKGRQGQSTWFLAGWV